MRTLKITLILITICSTQAIGQKDNDVFTITIDESVMLGSSKTLITQDSIIATSRYYLKKARTSEFRKALTNAERDKIRQLLSKINLDNLKDSYYSNMVDDHYEFKFTFDFNNKIKVTTIYGIRQVDIFKLVGQINKMIPKDYEIQYNDNYLKSFEATER